MGPEQQYTPGPWTVENDGMTVSMGGQCVIVGPAPDGSRIDEERANARLIAAAPDLLVACKALLAYANDYSDTMATSGQGAEQLGELADSVSVAGQARTAIALAERTQS